MEAGAVKDWSMTLLFDQIIPQLREGGMTDEQLETMLVDNPRRWLVGEGCLDGRRRPPRSRSASRTAEGGRSADHFRRNTYTAPSSSGGSTSLESVGSSE